MSLGFGTPVLLHTFFLFWAATFFCESLKSFKQISSCSSRYQMSCHVHSGFFIPRNLVVYISSCQLRCRLWITLSFSSFASMAGFVSALLCTHFSTCFRSSGWGSSFLHLWLLGGMGGMMKGCGRMELVWMWSSYVPCKQKMAIHWSLGFIGFIWFHSHEYPFHFDSFRLIPFFFYIHIPNFLYSPFS